MAVTGLRQILRQCNPIFRAALLAMYGLSSDFTDDLIADSRPSEPSAVIEYQADSGDVQKGDDRRESKV